LASPYFDHNALCLTHTRRPSKCQWLWIHTPRKFSLATSVLWTIIKPTFSICKTFTLGENMSALNIVSR